MTDLLTYAWNACAVIGILTIVCSIVAGVFAFMNWRGFSDEFEDGSP